MKNDLRKVLITVLVLYFLQFIVAPGLFPIYYPSTNESTVFLFGSIAIGTFVGMLSWSDKLIHWLLCDIPYFLLMTIYSNNGAYGIGVVGIPMDGNQLYYDRSVAFFLVLYVAVLTILIQIMIWVVIKILKWILRFITKIQSA